MVQELIVDVGPRHKKVAHPNDVLSWTFSPGMLDLGSDDDDDSDDDDSDDDDSDLEAHITELLVDSLLN